MPLEVARHQKDGDAWVTSLRGTRSSLVTRPVPVAQASACRLALPRQVVIRGVVYDVSKSQRAASKRDFEL